MRPYILVRSKRKTAVLYVTASGVEVRAPMRMPKREIDRFVASKEKWIDVKIAKLRERQLSRDAFIVNYGDFIFLRGIKLPVIQSENKRTCFDPVYPSREGSGAFMIPEGFSPEQVKTACVKIYRKLAKKYLTERVSFYSDIMNTSPASVKINGAKTRWGSCSVKRNVNFSWRIIPANDDLIDYVVVHELAHLIEMNHSARFWEIVEGVLPDYRERQSRLKELQRRLMSEDWK